MIVILDGTMSSLRPGCETNAGLAWRLLSESAHLHRHAVYYEAGVQWHRWADLRDVIEGRGLNRQIKRAYGWLASRYRPGDRIFLLGFSRGGYAVRSLSGVIEKIGLLRPECATERNVHAAYRYFRTVPDSYGAQSFGRLHCHPETPIEMIGAWDCVRSVGLPWPIDEWATMAHRFHTASPAQGVQRAIQALARDETREAFRPLLWRPGPDWPGTCEQVWFPGTHGDVGGHFGRRRGWPRGLSNAPLVWVLSHAEEAGLGLPSGWRARFPCDPAAPSIGQDRGLGLLMRDRRPRDVGSHGSERIAGPEIFASCHGPASDADRASGRTGATAMVYGVLSAAARILPGGMTGGGAGPEA